MKKRYQKWLKPSAATNVFSSELRLWHAVIKLAIRDACGIYVNESKQKSAFAWIQGSSDFKYVCGIAGMESDEVRGYFFRVLNSKNKFELLDRIEM